MDESGKFRYFSDMDGTAAPIPVWQLYGELLPFPDVMHIERIVDRAAGLDWTIAPHRHLHLHQIFLLTAGEVTMTLDAPPRRLALPACVNVPRGAVHGFTFSAGTEGFVLTLPAEVYPMLFAPEAEVAAVLARPAFLPDPDRFTPLFRAMAETYAQPIRFRRSRLAAEATALACRVAEAIPDTAGARPKAPDPRLARFEAMVRDHLRARLTVAEFARRLAVSPRHLSRLCRAATGQSAQDYIDSQTIGEACRLLVYTRMSVQEVGWHLGFDDPAYFARVFHRRTGHAPRDYRARFEG